MSNTNVSIHSALVAFNIICFSTNEVVGMNYEMGNFSEHDGFINNT